MLAALNATGRAAVVLDTGAVSRGSGSRAANKEKTIRKGFVENDLVEGVALLPENLFYNTTAPGIVLLINRSKPAERKGQILLVNASAYFVKEKPKNRLTDEGIRAIVEVFRNWESKEKLSRVVSIDDLRASDYNLSPSQFVEVNDKAQHRSLAAILADLSAAKVERERADAEVGEILAKLGLKV
jgi:type I restriction enzyme M protein